MGTNPPGANLLEVNLPRGQIFPGGKSPGGESSGANLLEANPPGANPPLTVVVVYPKYLTVRTKVILERLKPSLYN